MGGLDQVEREVVGCFACPRLVAWREKVAAEKVARFASWDYWGRPVPGFGDPDAHLLIVGLAPAAHGANRTGRVFTGDRSGDFLFASLFRTGYANQPTSVHADDGLVLDGCYVTATVKCAPPANKPTPSERAACRPFLERELQGLPRLRVVVALGQLAWDGVVRHHALRPKPRFAHGAEVALPDESTLVGSYHVSQQNTFTGVLTEPMLDAIFARARAI
ncbi:MAG: uracil-DNA glycosylase [Acidimicrobiales bacterium]